MWGYHVSCLVTIVIKDRSYGIDLYTEERRVYTSGLGLVGNPMMTGTDANLLGDEHADAVKELVRGRAP